MASLLSGLGSMATGIGAGIGSAAKSANTFMGSDIGGMTGAVNDPGGLGVSAGTGATGINWNDVLKAAQSGGNTKGMMPLANKTMLAQNNADKRTDLQEAIMIASTLWGGGI